MYGQFNKCQGYFFRIQWDIISQGCDWKCNTVWENTITSSANGYRDNERYCLNATTNQLVKDTNGNEIYSSIGTISTGKCAGAQLILESELHIAKGRCDCESGVTELYSRQYCAVIAVKGICDTTCLGTVWAHYWPGKQ